MAEAGLVGKRTVGGGAIGVEEEYIRAPKDEKEEEEAAAASAEKRRGERQ